MERIYKFGLDWETDIHAGLARITGLNGYFSPISTRRLLKYIDAFDPDVVHIHELHAYFVNLRPLLNYLKKKQIKVVWTFHCEYMYTGKCGHAHECKSFMADCGNCPAVKDYPKSLFFDRTKKMLRDKKKLLSDWDFKIITPSRWLADRVQLSFLKNKDISVIHNGIDTENIFYLRNKEDTDRLKASYGIEGKRIVLSVAPNIMSEGKGGEKVIEVSKHFGNDIHFVLVGADEDEKRGDNVTLIKRTANQDELALWYSAADVFLICSKKETFSMTCAEAMCCGTAIVGYKSGAPETIFPEPYAFFCDYGEVENIVKLLNLQLTSNLDKADISRFGRELYDKKVMCSTHEKLYENEIGATQPMRILLLDVNCGGSSTGKIVYDLYQNLNSSGHTAAICYGRGKKMEKNSIRGGYLYKFGLDWETDIHAALARATGLNGYFSPISTRRLIAFIKQFKPDVVHIHELHAYFVNLRPLLNYLKKKQIKVVWTFHCEYMYTGKCGYAYECEGWKNDCGSCPKVREYPKSILFDGTRKMLRDKKKLLFDWDFQIVTPSRWLADRVKQSFLKDKSVAVIHNGIDTEGVFHLRDAREVSELKIRYGIDGQKIVLSVAPNIMDERKGGKTVLEISRSFVGQNVHFVLVGADDDEKRGDNVTLIKRTANQDELALWYSAADVFLICSKKENFPTTCLEALCCGAPIVGIDAGGTRETAPAPYGAFAQPGDIENLVKLIKVQFANNFDKTEISRFGRELYDKKVMYMQYLDIYKK